MLELNQDNFSSELTSFFNFVEEELISDFPSPVITVDYLILALIDKQDCLARRVLNFFMSNVSLQGIRTAYYGMLSNHQVTSINPNKKLKLHTLAQTYLNLAQSEKLNGGNEEKLTTVHLLMAFLNPKNPEIPIRSILNHVGVTYPSILSKISLIDTITSEASSEKGKPKSTKKNGEDKLLQAITGTTSNSTASKSSLSTYCINLSASITDLKAEPIFGREQEFNEMLSILCRKKKNNVAIVGNAGVGKTSMLYKLAQKIMSGEVPSQLANKQVLMLNPTALVAGTQWRGMFEERINALLKDLKAQKNIILAIDNVETVFVKDSTMSKDSGNSWSKLLEDGDIPMIITSDFNGFHLVMDNSPTMSRRFKKMVIEPATVQETTDILTALQPSYEKFHKIKFSPEAISECVYLADKYIVERKMPDSAIDIFDEVGAHFSLAMQMKDSLKELNKLKAKLENDIVLLKKEDKYEDAKEVEKELDKVIVKINTFSKASINLNKGLTLSKNDVDNVFATAYKIPVETLSDDDKEKMKNLESELKKNIIGQDEAIKKICRCIKRSRIGLSHNPVYCSALMIGNTGVGKTFLAKQLAKQLFGSENNMVRIDMSEYSEQTSVAKLIGTNPGYVGYEKGGILTEAVKNKKHCVLLLDEIEKAHSDIYNIFLQILDEGFVTDNLGLKVDFHNTIILATSNVGTKTAATFSNGIGFNENKDSNYRKILEKELDKKFPPEFLNRFNDIIYFNSLSDDVLKKIIANQLDNIKNRIFDEKGLVITYYDCVIDKLLQIIDCDKKYGARPINRAIDMHIIDKITDCILDSNENIVQCIVSVDENDNIFVRASSQLETEPFQMNFADDTI